MRHKLIVLTLIALLILSCSVPVFAQEFDGSQTGSITITLVEPTGNQPVTGAQFDVYHVAAVGINADQNLNYIYLDAFQNCNIPLDDPDLPRKLSAFVENQDIAAIRIVTDSYGVATCTNLPLGLFLVKQVNAVDGFSVCTPFLVTIPMQNGIDFEYDVDASPKADVVRLVSITLKKVWNTDEFSEIPDSVTVQLLREGMIVKTAFLNKDNHWQVTYHDMPESDGYSLEEVNIPKGFTATYSEKNYEFIVTNTASLAQTGQLIWPIPVLAVVGLGLLMLGYILLQKPENSHA